MVRKNDNRSPDGQKPHRCSVTCLGPLTFHAEVVGSEVRLSDGGFRARRSGSTFKNGLVFLSRPVRIQERIRLRVERGLCNWHGALRVGFTTIPPSTRHLPLPCMAIPNLTDRGGHWAAPVPSALCQEGMQLDFWVSNGGSIHIGSGGREEKILTGVDLSLPLWAMIDVYGQTCCISVLGSKKKELMYTRKSCPAPQRILSPSGDPPPSRTLPILWERSNDRTSCRDEKFSAGGDVTPCVICLSDVATVTLPCAHRCLCHGCTPRVLREFATCPLCRHNIYSGWSQVS